MLPDHTPVKKIGGYHIGIGDISTHFFLLRLLEAGGGGGGGRGGGQAMWIGMGGLDERWSESAAGGGWTAGVSGRTLFKTVLLNRILRDC